MSKRKNAIVSMIVGLGVLAVIILSEAYLKAPQLLTDQFCMLDKEAKICGIQTLALCMIEMQGGESKCVRQVAEKPDAMNTSK